MFHGTFFFLLVMLGNFIGIFLGEIAPFTVIMDAMSLCFSAMYNALLHASGHFLEDKIEERITFALSHAHLYLAESDDK